MSRIIERALSIINDNLKDQTSSFADPISIKPMARGGRLLEDDYPTHYLPHVGRQVMADGGALVKGFEGRVSSPPPVEEPAVTEGVEAYHGSPHEFEEFDPAKIGTGEGAQVYGHGLYFAGNENIAKYYRDSLTDPDNVPLHFKGRPVDTVWNDEISDRWHDVVKKLPKDHEEDFQTVMGNLSQIKDLADLKHVQANLDRKQKNILNKVVLPELSKPETGSGHMYEVRLDAHPEEHLLDWDKPLKDQHPNVIAAFNKAVVPVKDDEDKMIHEMYGDKAAHEYLGLFDKSKGSQAYKTFAEQIGGQDKASEALSKAGIRGIRYLDAGSRGQDETSGSHNYVIFDPQHIKVKRRYAEGGEVPEDKDEGIVAYAFGNSIPHLDKRYEEEAPSESKLAKGVEPVSEAPQQGAYAYGGAIPGPRLTEDNADDFARRLIAWTFATAPLFQRASGGEVTYPVSMPTEIKEDIEAGKAKMKHLSPQEFLDEADPLNIGKGDRHIIHSFEKHIKSGDHLGPLKLYEKGHQDGRHRANAAKDLGVKKVPVVDYRKADGGAVDDDQGYDDSGLTAANLSDALLAAKQARQELISRNLPDRQRYAVNQYSGSQYETVNKSLRKPFNDPYKQNYASSIASNLRLAMRPLQTDINVYRGIKSPKHVGDAVSFSSTSLSPEIAQSFAGEKGHIMKIRVKKGTPVAYGDVASEREVILPPGKVNITKKTKSGPYTYHHGSYESLSNGGSVIDAALDVVSKLRR